MIKELKWDSDFFGYKIGSCQGNQIEEEGSDKFEVEFRSNRFDCVYVFCGPETTLQFTGSGYKNVLPMDGHTEYALSEPKIATVPTGNNSSCKCTIVKEKEGEETCTFQQIRALSEELALVSRFYADPAFRPKAREMYGIWMDKILKDPNGLVVMGMVNSTLAGVIASQMKGDLGVIELVKTKRGFEDMGVGSSMLRYTIASLFEKGAKKISVKTQEYNRPARHLYEKLGFVCGDSTKIYHWWKTASA